MGKAYVYAVHVDGVLRYLGKGNGRRMLKHVAHADHINTMRLAGRKVKTTPFYNKLAKALRHGATIRHEIVKKGLTDRQAFGLEIELIAAARARTPGQLWNVSAGGAGLTPARARKLFSDVEYRKRLSAAIKKATNMPEERLARSLRRRRFLATPEGDRHLRRLVKASHTPEASRRRSEGLKRANLENPDINRRRSKSVRRSWSDQKLRQRQSTLSLAYYSNRKNRQRHALNIKRSWVRRREKFGPSGGNRSAKTSTA